MVDVLDALNLRVAQARLVAILLPELETRSQGGEIVCRGGGGCSSAASTSSPLASVTAIRLRSNRPSRTA